MIELSRLLKKEGVQECCPLRLCLLQCRVRKIDWLAPVRGHEEEKDHLSPPGVEHVADGDVVAERLRHLLAAELKHPVMRPDARKRMSERMGLRKLVLVVREDEIKATTVDLEHR